MAQIMGMDSDLTNKDLLDAIKAVTQQVGNNFIKPDNQIWLTLGLNGQDFQSKQLRGDITRAILQYAGTDKDQVGRDKLGELIKEILKAQDSRITEAGLGKKINGFFDRAAVELLTEQNKALVAKAQQFFVQKEEQAQSGQTQQAQRTGETATGLVAELSVGAKRLANIEGNTAEGRAHAFLSAEILESLRTTADGQKVSATVQADILRAATVSGFSAAVVLAKAEEWHVLSTTEQKGLEPFKSKDLLTDNTLAGQVRERISILYKDLQQYYKDPNHEADYDKRRAQMVALIGERKTKAAENQITKQVKAEQAFANMALYEQLSASAALRNGQYGEIVPKKVRAA